MLEMCDLVDYLYHMHKLFNMHMEDFLVSYDDASDLPEEENTEDAQTFYALVIIP